MAKIVTIFITLIFLLNACSTVKTYPYPLTEKNKEIIKDVFTNGVVSCRDGYCFFIEREEMKNGKYIIRGGRFFGISIVLKSKPKGNNTSFKSGMKIRNLILQRLPDTEKAFLEELSHRLMPENKTLLDSLIANELKTAELKANKKKK